MTGWITQIVAIYFWLCNFKNGTSDMKTFKRLDKKCFHGHQSKWGLIVTFLFYSVFDQWNNEVEAYLRGRRATRIVSCLQHAGSFCQSSNIGKKTWVIVILCYVWGWGSQSSFWVHTALALLNHHIIFHIAHNLSLFPWIVDKRQQEL